MSANRVSPRPGGVWALLSALLFLFLFPGILFASKAPEPQKVDSLKVAEYSASFVLRGKGILADSAEKYLKVFFGRELSPELHIRQLDSLSVRVITDIPSFVLPGDSVIYMQWKKRALWEPQTFFFQQEIFIPNPTPGAGDQPEIFRINPIGVEVGQSLAVYGRNFGNSLDSIRIYLSDPDSDTINTLLAEYNPLAATYLSLPDEKGIQKIVFNIPDQNRFLKRRNRFFPDEVRNSNILLTVTVKGQPSATPMKFAIINTNWKWVLVLNSSLALLAIVLLWLFIFFRYARRTGRALSALLISLIVEKKTNMISLGRMQALFWTIVLLWSYFYVFGARFMFVDNFNIPDFPKELLFLMGISLGGLAISIYQADKPKASIKATKPSMADLLMQDGTLSLHRLQLVFFNLSIMVIYVNNLLASDDVISEGMPTLPPTLVVLLGVSAGGYLTGKALTKGIFISDISSTEPLIAGTSSTTNRIIIQGDGFMQNMEIHLSPHDPDQVSYAFDGFNRIEITPGTFPAAGPVALSIRTPNGLSVSIPNALTVQAAKPATPPPAGGDAPPPMA